MRLLNLGDPTRADAILDRHVHNSFRLNLAGESMRKKKTTKSTATPVELTGIIRYQSTSVPLSQRTGLRQISGPRSRGLADGIRGIRSRRRGKRWIRQSGVGFPLGT